MEVLRSLRAQGETGAVIRLHSMLPSWMLPPTPVFLRALSMLYSSPPPPPCCRKAQWEDLPWMGAGSRLSCNSFLLSPSYSRFAWHVDFLQEQGRPIAFRKVPRRVMSPLRNPRRSGWGGPRDFLPLCPPHCSFLSWEGHRGCCRRCLSSQASLAILAL